MAVQLIDPKSVNLEQVFAEYVNSAETEVLPASEYEAEFLDVLDGVRAGVKCPFSPKLQFRPGEVTIWGGINGHGKSLFTGQLLELLAFAGQSVHIQSFEMSPARTLERMCQQYHGKKLDTLRNPGDRELARSWLETIGQRMTLLNVVGAANPRQCYGAAIYAATQFGAKHILVDNLAKVIVEEGDQAFTAQKTFVTTCTDIARRYGVHVHIVHHVRKSGSEEEPLDRFAFKGTGAIVDMCDNAVILQRNVGKERRQDSDDATTPDSWLRVLKQRNGDWEGTCDLWYNPLGKTFCLGPERMPPPFADAIARKQSAASRFRSLAGVPDDKF